MNLILVLSLFLFCLNFVASQTPCNFQYPGYVPPPGDNRTYYLPTANGTIPGWASCPNSAICDSGKFQSPIAIDTSKVIADPDLGSISISWKKIDNTSLSWTGTFQSYSTPPRNQTHPSWLWQSVLPDEKMYLGQFHLHTPAEHPIDGHYYDVEVHFVHRNAAGNVTAVIAIMFEVGTADDWSEFFEIMLNEHPDEHSNVSSVTIKDIYPGLALAEVPSRSYYHYIGSFTFPPCTEGLYWFMMIDPVKIHQSQFDRLLEFQGTNNRPLQKMAGRTVTLFKEGPETFCSEVGSDCEVCTKQCESSCKTTCKNYDKDCKKDCNAQCLKKLCDEVC